MAPIGIPLPSTPTEEVNRILEDKILSCLIEIRDKVNRRGNSHYGIRRCVFMGHASENFLMFILAEIVGISLSDNKHFFTVQQVHNSKIEADYIAAQKDI